MLIVDESKHIPKTRCKDNMQTRPFLCKKIKIYLLNIVKTQNLPLLLENPEVDFRPDLHTNI